MIRYGPAGIPLSCKGRTLKDGIEDVHNLCLTALEVQLVRPRTLSRPAEDEEIGLTLAQLGPESEFVIGIEKEGEFVYDRDVPIFEDDNLIQLLVPPAATFNDLAKLGKIARRHDVALSAHTPYYMDLGGDPGLDDESGGITMQYLDILQQSAIITDALGGNIVVTSLGPYDDRVRSREDTDENIRNNLEYLMEFWHQYGLRPKLGLEISGDTDVFGSRTQIFELCDDIKGLVPVLNFANLQARMKGKLETPQDFSRAIADFEGYGNGHIWANFSNVELDPETGSEKYLTPLKKGNIKFEKLAEAIAEDQPDITLVSCSPLLEHDAVYMRTLVERVLSKKAAKILKERKKLESENASA